MTSSRAMNQKRYRLHCTDFSQSRYIDTKTTQTPAEMLFKDSPDPYDPHLNTFILNLNILLAEIHLIKLIAKTTFSLLHKQCILNLIPLANRVLRRLRPDGAEKPIDSSTDNEAGEEVQSVDVDCSDWDAACSHSISEAEDVDHNAAEVSCPAAPLDTVNTEIWTGFLCAVEVVEFEIAFADEVVVRDHWARDG